MISMRPIAIPWLRNKLPTQLRNLDQNGFSANASSPDGYELPVDPALENELEEQEEALRDRLRSQFGPGFETSSPGIESLSEFEERASNLRSQARTGQLSLAEQLFLARQGSQRAETTQGVTTLRDLIGDPGRTAQGFGSAASGFGAAQQPFIQNRQMQLRANLFNAQNQTSPFATFGRIAGIGVGAALGNPSIGTLFCDERLKTDIEDVGLDLLPGVPIICFTNTLTGERRIGVTAQSLAPHIPEAVGELAGYLTLDWAEVAARLPEARFTEPEMEHA